MASADRKGAKNKRTNKPNCREERKEAVLQSRLMVSSGNCCTMSNPPGEILWNVPRQFPCPKAEWQSFERPFLHSSLPLILTPYLIQLLPPSCPVSFPYCVYSFTYCPVIQNIKPIIQACLLFPTHCLSHEEASSTHARSRIMCFDPWWKMWSFRNETGDFAPRLPQLI